MKYLKNITTLSELKKAFRALVIANHPDKGGDTKTMQEINAEFETLYNSLKDCQEATAQEYMQHVYEENGWTGKNYTGEHDLQKLAKIFRDWLRKVYPACKFSVVTSRGYRTVEISLSVADFNPFTGENKKHYDISRYDVEEDPELTDRAKDMFANIRNYVNTYNYDHSDLMSDYYDTNFYIHLGIGQYEKPFKIEIPKKRRANGAAAPSFEWEDGPAHKALKKALGKHYFAEEQFKEGPALVLGDTAYYVGKESFSPLYRYCSGSTPARRCIEKLASIGVICELFHGCVKFVGYTPEMERALKEEDEARERAFKKWQDEQNRKQEEAEQTEMAQAVDGLEIVDYSEKAVAVFGETMEIKEQLKALGGKFNPSLRYGNGKRAGWVFPKARRKELERLAKPETIEQESAKETPADVPRYEVITHRNECGSLHVETMQLKKICARLYKDEENLYFQYGEYIYIFGAYTRGIAQHLKEQGDNIEPRVIELLKQNAPHIPESAKILLEKADKEGTANDPFPLENISFTETDYFNGVYYYDIGGAGIIKAAKVRDSLKPGDIFNVYTEQERKYGVTYDGASLNRSLYAALPGIMEAHNTTDTPTPSDVIICTELLKKYPYPSIAEEMDGFKVGEVVFDQCGQVGVILAFYDGGEARTDSNGVCATDRLKKCPYEIAEKSLPYILKGINAPYKEEPKQAGQLLTIRTNRKGCALRGNDATKAAEILGLQTESTPDGVAVLRFDALYIDTYITRLIRNGQRVRLSDEPEEEPQPEYRRPPMNGQAFTAFASCLQKRLQQGGGSTGRRYAKRMCGKYGFTFQQLRYTAYLIREYAARSGETSKPIAA